MTRRWARPRGFHDALCGCGICARLDAAHPGEGRQLVLPLADFGGPLQSAIQSGGGKTCQA